MYSNHIILACVCTLTWEMDDFLKEITPTLHDVDTHLTHWRSL